jgi:DNA-binding CsgD family transcriptional regulator
MKNMIIQRIRQGADPSSLATELNISIRQVYRYISGIDMRLLRRVRNNPELERSTARVLFESGLYTRQQIADKLGVTYQYIYQVTQ